MGWQSYLAFYTSKDELGQILGTINIYQKIWFGDIVTDQEIGEDIQGVCFARVTNFKKYKDKYVVLFGIGGGRGYCYDFFASKGVYLVPFESDMTKHIENHDLWFKYDGKSESEKYKYFTDEFIDELENLGYSNLFSVVERTNALKFIKRNKIYWNEEVVNLTDNELNEIMRQTIEDKEELRAQKQAITRANKKLNVK